MSDRPPPLGAVLRTLRLGAGLTRDQLADRAGLHRLIVARLESTATARPSDAALYRLAGALGVAVERLTGGA